MEALWAQGLGTVKKFDKSFWTDVVKHGMAKYLTGLDAYPSCQLKSVCFGHECEQEDDEDWAHQSSLPRCQHQRWLRWRRSWQTRSYQRVNVGTQCRV
eukprot:5051019-Amphidinium_carterae.2